MMRPGGGGGSGVLVEGLRGLFGSGIVCFTYLCRVRDTRWRGGRLRPPIRIIQHGGSQICHRARGPPGVAEPVEKHDALFQFFRRPLDVHFQPPGPEVAVHDGQRDRERVGD
jgi:hypothetical protein